MTFMLNNLFNLVSSLAVGTPSSYAPVPDKAAQASWTSALADASRADMAAADASRHGEQRSAALVVQAPTASSTVALAAKTPVSSADADSATSPASDSAAAADQVADVPSDDSTTAAADGALSAPTEPVTEPVAQAPAPAAAAAPPAPSEKSPANAEFERQQAYLANVRQFLAQTSSGAYLTGSSTLPNGTDAAARLPVDMLSAGITPSTPVLNDYSRVTGLDAKTVTSPSPSTTLQPAAVSGPTAFEQQQAYLAGVRQLLATQSAGAYLTGSSSMADGTDGAAYLPSEMLSAGITPSQTVLDAYTRVTGLDSRQVSATRPQFDAHTGSYHLPA